MIRTILSIFLIISVLMIAPFSFAAPSITGNSGTWSHGNSVSITGSGFGTKSQAAPVAYSNMEAGSVNAVSGSWDQSGFPVGVMTVSTTHPRNANNPHNGYCSVKDEGNGQGTVCAFQGAATSQYWYAQYWFYVDSAFSWSTGPSANGNNKLFRLFHSGGNIQDLVIEGTPPGQPTMFMNLEGTDESHGGWGTGWEPVSPQYTCIDQAFGHSCQTDYWHIYPSDIGWAYFATDMAPNTWHHFQFEYHTSSLDTANGTLRWWIDGKPVFNHSDMIMKTSTNSGEYYPARVGIEAIHANGEDGAVGNYWIDDAYIDNTWQRVEIGNNATYNSCTLKEIQLPTAWTDGSISFSVNQGSFSNGATGYVFVTDASGVRNTGYTVTFGSGGGDTTAPTATITAPTSNATYSTSTTPLTTLAGTASDDTGVSSVTWACPTCTPTSGTATGTTSWSVSSIGLSSGSNVITVTAHDAATNTGDDTLTVTYTPVVNGIRNGCYLSGGKF